MTEEELVQLLTNNLKLVVEQKDSYNGGMGEGSSSMYDTYTSIELYYGDTYLGGGST